MTKISKILVANRGEIALRVMQTARRLGLSSVAVYSDADKTAPHVIYADEAVCIGEPPVGKSYLRGDAIIAAAQKVGADAIHPGYGFLSENAQFAQAVVDAGLIFIGPSAEAIELMGNKAAAKRLMIAAGVPCVPGYEGEEQSDDILIKVADEIGFPIMVKAAAGGGGRGMRLVYTAKELPTSISTARSEAKNAFGSDELILEKAIIKPRHVEVQVFADQFGSTIHFGERDCSVQRRHQKVIEEAPCPVMTVELREKMGMAAVEAAQSISYCGAGTVEFLLDTDGSFYFLEMNTRLQVEHPVTEAITGVDLVALQISVAQGEPLGLSQEDVRFNGHAIEVRLYAEDPANGFLPSTGRVVAWHPAEVEGLRYDAGIVSGQDVSPFYDPMIAKVIAHGPDREVARQRLQRALRDTVLFGLPTNRDFLLQCLEQRAFVDGEATTAFISECFGEEGLSAHSPTEREKIMHAVGHFVQAQMRHKNQALNLPDTLLNFSTQGALRSILELDISGLSVRADITAACGKLDVTVGETRCSVEIDRLTRELIKCRVDGHTVTMQMVLDQTNLYGNMDGITLLSVNKTGHALGLDDGAQSGRVTAPMHGRVIRIDAVAGEHIEAGEQICVVEAMKMQHEITAQVSGVVQDIYVSVDQQVAAGDLLAEIEEA